MLWFIMNIIIKMNKRNEANYKRTKIILEEFCNEIDTAYESKTKNLKVVGVDVSSKMPVIVAILSETKEGFEIFIPLDLNIMFRAMGVGRGMKKAVEEYMKEKGVIYDKICVQRN